MKFNHHCSWVGTVGVGNHRFPACNDLLEEVVFQLTVSTTYGCISFWELFYIWFPLLWWRPWQNLGKKTYNFHWGKSGQKLSTEIWGQKLKQRPGEILLRGLLSIAYSPCLVQSAFLYNSGPPDQEWHHPQRAGSFHNNPWSTKCPTGLPIGQSDGGIFWTKVPSSVITLVCVKWIKILTNAGLHCEASYVTDGF